MVIWLQIPSHNILNRWKNYFSQLLNVHRVSEVRQIEIHTAEPIAPDPSWGCNCYCKVGRAITQAVSRQLPTAAARVRAKVRRCGICGGQSSNGAGFHLVLQFPLPVLITPTAPHSPPSVIRGWYNRPITGRRTKWTQPHPTPRI
jgi:hypothetical protein